MTYEELRHDDRWDDQPQPRAKNGFAGALSGPFVEQRIQCARVKYEGVYVPAAPSWAARRARIRRFTSRIHSVSRRTDSSSTSTPSAAS